MRPDTVLRWHRGGFRLFWRWKSKPKSRNPNVSAETIARIRRMAAENRLWGAERIRGELLTLGVRVAKRTVQRYMLAVRRRPPTGQTWQRFSATTVTRSGRASFDHVLVLGEHHLLTVLVEYCRYFNDARPQTWQSH